MLNCADVLADSADLWCVSEEHLDASTRECVTESSHSQVGRLEELVNEQDEQGAALGQVDRLQTLQHLLHKGRLQSESEQNESEQNESTSK